MSVPDWFMILPSNYLLSFDNTLLPPPSRSRAVPTQTFSEAALGTVIHSSLGSPSFFFKYLYWNNLLKYTSVYRKKPWNWRRQPVRLLPSACFLAAVKRSQNTGLEGVQTETTGT